MSLLRILARALTLSLICLSVDGLATGASNFLPLCRMFAEQQGAKNAVTIISPVDVGAPALAVDSKVQFLVFNDPNYLAGMAYCYFAFRGWIDAEKFSPDDIVLASSGFSILNEDIASYKKWLEANASGKKCRARVEKESGVPVTDLAAALKGYAAIVGINPLASVKSGKLGFEPIHDEMRLTVNHERIHAYQVLCPNLEAWGQKKWKELPAEEQAKFPLVYPSYNWKDLKVAGREYVAYSFEGKPLRISDHVGKCKIK
jgi:hypothetical protein